METKHTKGEWNCEVDDYYTYKYNLTSLVRGLINLPSRKEAEYNAKLIESAPDLLEALIELYDSLPDGYESECLQKVRQAIKKATE